MSSSILLQSVVLWCFMRCSICVGGGGPFLEDCGLAVGLFTFLVYRRPTLDEHFPSASSDFPPNPNLFAPGAGVPVCPLSLSVFRFLSPNRALFTGFFCCSSRYPSSFPLPSLELFDFFSLFFLLSVRASSTVSFGTAAGPGPFVSAR